METGIYPSLDRRAYDALEERVNWSTLRALARSGEHYQHALGTEMTETAAMRLGSAVHVAVLEPELFGSIYVVWEGGRRAGKAWEAFCEEHAGREILTLDEYERCVAMQARVRQHPIAGPYVRGGQSEVTILWEETLPAVSDQPAIVTPMRGRIDYLRDDVIVDLKTTRDGSPDGFGREVWRLRYHTQLAIYQAGVKAITGKLLPVKIVTVESEAPHVVTVYDMPEHVLEIGREEYRALLSHLDWCKREGRWPGYSDTETEILLPRWVMPRGEDDDIAGMDLAIGE